MKIIYLFRTQNKSNLDELNGDFRVICGGPEFKKKLHLFVEDGRIVSSAVCTHRTIAIERVFLCCLGGSSNSSRQKKIACSTVATSSSKFRRLFDEYPSKGSACNRKTALRKLTATPFPLKTSKMSSNSGATAGACAGGTTASSQVNGNSNSAPTSKNNDSSCSSSNTEDYNEIEERRRRIKNRSR